MYVASALAPLNAKSSHGCTFVPITKVYWPAGRLERTLDPTWGAHRNCRPWFTRVSVCHVIIAKSSKPLIMILYLLSLNILNNHIMQLSGRARRARARPTRLPSARVTSCSEATEHHRRRFRWRTAPPNDGDDSEEHSGQQQWGRRGPVTTHASSICSYNRVSRLSTRNRSNHLTAFPKIL